MAEGVGFEPTNPCGFPVFKTGAFNRSAIPPTVGGGIIRCPTPIGKGIVQVVTPLLPLQPFRPLQSRKRAALQLGVSRQTRPPDASNQPSKKHYRHQSSGKDFRACEDVEEIEITPTGEESWEFHSGEAQKYRLRSRKRMDEKPKNRLAD
jgi:hypothetical protein